MKHIYMEEYFAQVSDTLCCVAYIALHLICGQTNYYITVL